MYVFFLCKHSGESGKRGEKGKGKAGKKANTILGPSRQFFKELGERLSEAEQKGIFNSQEEEKEQEVEPDPCPCCGRKGHEESMCQFGYESVRAWRNKPKQQWKTWQEKNEAASEQKNPTTIEAEPSKGKVSMVCVDDQTPLHSPVWIHGVNLLCV